MPPHAELPVAKVRRCKVKIPFTYPPSGLSLLAPAQRVSHHLAAVLHVTFSPLAVVTSTHGDFWAGRGDHKEAMLVVDDEKQGKWQ